MRGKPVAAEASMTLQQPEGVPCVVLGKFSLDLGTLTVAGCTGSWGGVDSDLCLHTGFLVAVAAALAFHAHLWVLS